MKLILSDMQKCKLSISIKNAAGNDAPVDGAPQWASSNSEVLTVTPSEDGMSADVVAVGPLGSATVSVKADADLGEGVSQIAGSMDVEVVASAATTVEITAGETTPK